MHLVNLLLLLQACAGLAYSFSVYAPTIKDSLDLTQTQLATVGSAVNLGGYFAIVSGSIYDALKDYHKLGPRCVGLGTALPAFTSQMQQQQRFNKRLHSVEATVRAHHIQVQGCSPFGWW
jgi:hypothetical protein